MEEAELANYTAILVCWDWSWREFPGGTGYFSKQKVRYVYHVGADSTKPTREER